MATMSELEQLARHLERLADEVEASTSITGQHVEVTAPSGFRGNMTGQRIEVTAPPGFLGSITGQRIKVSAGAADPEALQAAQELRKLAEQVRSGQSDQPRIRAVLAVVGNLANAAATAFTRGVVSAFVDRFAW